MIISLFRKPISLVLRPLTTRVLSPSRTSSSSKLIVLLDSIPLDLRSNTLLKSTFSTSSTTNMPPKSKDDKYTDPELRQEVKEEVQAGDKGYNLQSNPQLQH
jgi:hypothetical protein